MTRAGFINTAVLRTTRAVAATGATTSIAAADLRSVDQLGQRSFSK